MKNDDWWSDNCHRITNFLMISITIGYATGVNALEDAIQELKVFNITEEEMVRTAILREVIKT